MRDDEINLKHLRGEGLVIIEHNRKKIASLVQLLAPNSDNSYHIELNPANPKRADWNITKKSRLIESFLINIPVPQIILYQTKFNCYQVIDGQQRIIAIRDFYTNQFALTDLEFYPEFNGLKYEELSASVRANLGRKSITFNTILIDSDDPEEALLIKQKAFERYHTGFSAEIE